MLHTGRDERDDDLFSVEVALQRDEAKERELLTCCYCNSPLEAVMLDTNPRTGEQRFFWACKKVKKDTCIFPVGMPSEVFFLKRTAAEKERGIIPKPDVLRLPKKYRGLYPTIFADDARSSRAGTRGGTPLSISAADMSSASQSPTTSGSSVASDQAAANHLLHMDANKKNPSPLITQSNQNSPESSACQSVDKFRGTECGSTAGESDVTRATSTSDGSAHTSVESPEYRSRAMDSTAPVLSCRKRGECTSVSSDLDSRSETSSEGGALAELICEQLQYAGVDVERLEDEELVLKMAGVVKKLHKDKRRSKYPGYTTMTEFRASVDYLFNLDVDPIKRKLNVVSTDLTHAVSVMRSNCDVDTMLDAMGGSTPLADPPAKRTKLMYSKQEVRKRVESILKDLSRRRLGNEDTAAASAETPGGEDDPSGATEWYEGEDGPSSSIAVPHETAESQLAVEERLNAIIQDRVRQHVTSSAARRHANRRRKVLESSLQPGLHASALTAESSLPLHVTSDPLTESYSEGGDLLSFDSPFFDNLGSESTSFDFPHEDLNQHLHPVPLVNDPPLPDPSDAHSNSFHSDSHSPEGDDEFHALFHGYEFPY